MVRFAVLCLVFLTALLVAVGCVGGQKPVLADLELRRFVLESVDGVPFCASRMPEMAFDENFRVSGQMCNRFMGQGKLENGVLTVAQMASTRMFCAEEALNHAENRISSMLMAGAEVELTDGILTLRQGGHTVTFTAADRVQ